ncbi:MAG: CPBP family intramembrane metalloprotease [Nitrososphaerota archaeon]|nr:CPBP family intramembrane metalloprotease [Nitrososphaerota archaeon]MDG6924123.1 CPBP family intramembrane metalloprotease [Nitrososphaerota archaeon]
MLTLGRSAKRYDQVVGFLIVAFTMVEMFTIPRSYFVLGSLVSTSTMIFVAYLLTPRKNWLSKPSIAHVILAVIVAVILYLVFVAGNLGIHTFQLSGFSSSGEQSIYNLFNNVPLPILLIVLVLDALGFESYFRGILLASFSSRLRIASVFLAAAIDASIHFASLNPLFPATTFIADSVWGFYYYKTNDLYSTILCHFIWDIMIFVLIPIH